MPGEKDQLRDSWVTNAAAWRDAVRERKIESRRVATDAAIVDVVTALAPKTVLDLGCGEGWLARQLTARGIDVAGVDASAPLIEAARELGGGSFHLASYEELALDGPFDVVVANFSILEEDVGPIFTSAARLGGTFVIQTVHPAYVSSGEPYVSGWRTETFASMDGEWAAPMPWYFRTIGDWVRVLAEHGFVIRDFREPLDAGQVRPLSMILACVRP